MLAYTYEENGKFVLKEKEKPTLQSEDDAIVRVTLASICSSDLHIKHGAVPRAVPGITVGHEMVGIVEETGRRVTKVKPEDRVTVNVETFCGECFFCKNGFVNNWTDEAALFVGDVLATGFWAARISEIGEEDTVVIIGGGPTGICTLLCVMLKNPAKIILCEVDPERIAFVKEHYPDVLVVNPKETDAERFVKENSRHNGADRVLEVAGSSDTFELAWKVARPNAIVTVVALYEENQTLPLPQMYGKNLIFKTGGVDGCDCDEILKLIEQGRIDTTPLITHTFPLEEIEQAYDIFENRKDNVIKIAVSHI